MAVPARADGAPSPVGAPPRVRPRTPRRRASGAWRHRAAKVVVTLVALTPLAYLAYGAWADTLGANPVEAIEFGTGKWTLRLLIATLAITPVRQVSGWNWLIKYRRLLGLLTFLFATVHLSVYFVLDVGFSVGDVVHDVIKHPYITMGMLAWLTLVPLAVTSTRGWVRRLGGKRWARLHRLVYVTAVAGCIHFLWAVKKDHSEPLCYIAIFGGLLFYRIWHSVSPRFARQSSGPSLAEPSSP
jgi:sulfoxide reductase heme-binding subunit YedZ